MEQKDLVVKQEEKDKRLFVLDSLYQIQRVNFHYFNILMCYLADNTGLTNHKEAIMALSEDAWHEFLKMVTKGYVVL